MTTITGLFDVSRRRLEDDSERTTAQSTTPRAPRGTEAIPEYRDAAFYARLTAATSAAPTETTNARDKAVQQRMDAVRDAYSGPYTVSSWGAGAHGADYGGFRRETWLLDASTKQWGFVDRETNTFVVSRDGPSVWDRFHGAYRPKVGA